MDIAGSSQPTTLYRTRLILFVSNLLNSFPTHFVCTRCFSLCRLSTSLTLPHSQSCHFLDLLYLLSLSNLVILPSFVLLVLVFLLLVPLPLPLPLSSAYISPLSSLQRKRIAKTTSAALLIRFRGGFPSLTSVSTGKYSTPNKKKSHTISQINISDGLKTTTIINHGI